MRAAIGGEIPVASGVFDSSGGNSLSLSGLRMTAKIETNGGASQTKLELSIYGMSLSDMNQLSTVGAQPAQVSSSNTVLLQAGDAQSGLAKVFQGVILHAWVEADLQPEVAFHIEAQPGGGAAVKPIPPTSIQGSGDADTILAGLAAQMGVAYESPGVSVKLANPYLHGAILSQIRSCAEACNLQWDINNGVLAVWPQGAARQSDGGPILISPQTGLIGYPAFRQSNLIVRALYNPSVLRGSRIRIESQLTPACGIWTVDTTSLDLASLAPSAKWFMTLTCSSKGAQGQA